MRRVLVCLAVLAFAAGCSGGASSVAPRRSAASTPSFAIPAPPPSFTVPRPPSLAAPPKPVTSVGRAVRSVHSTFFDGEAALGQGVYYLALPNGNPFGYYAYMSDPNYVYHFDAGYFYVIDANDGQGGVYLYDFTSSHWWYTSRTFPFPYVYDFTLNAILYYYPDEARPGRYGANPRYFYNFATRQIIKLPDPNPPSYAGTAQNVYVGDFDPSANGGPSDIVEFPGSAHGAVTPSRTLTTNVNVEANDFLVLPTGDFFMCGTIQQGSSGHVTGGCGAVARDKSNGHLYHAVIEAITEYDSTGKSVRRIPLNHSFIRGQAMAVDSAGNLYVGDSGTHQIDVYPRGATTPARHLGNVPGSPIYYPYALAFDSHDTLYVVDNGSVFTLAAGSDGSHPGGAPGGGYGGLPVSLAVDEKDELYVGSQPSGGKGPWVTVYPAAGTTNVQAVTYDLTGIVKYPISLAIGP